MGWRGGWSASVEQMAGEIGEWISCVDQHIEIHLRGWTEGWTAVLREDRWTERRMDGWKQSQFQRPSVFHP